VAVDNSGHITASPKLSRWDHCWTENRADPAQIRLSSQVASQTRVTVAAIGCAQPAENTIESASEITCTKKKFPFSKNWHVPGS